MAELADARDSKSRALHWACGFDPHLQHQTLESALSAKTLRRYREMADYLDADLLAMEIPMIKPLCPSRE